MLHIPETATPLWFELTKAFGGPLIAAVVVILGLLWRDWIERRNVAQAWFQQTYITDGIDVLIAHLSTLQTSFEPARRQIISTTAVVPFPSHLLGRLEVVVPGLEFLYASSTVEQFALSASKPENALLFNPAELNELYFFTGSLLSVAETIRLSLLRATVRSKEQVYTIRSNNRLMKLVKDREEQFLNGKTLHDVHRELIARLAPQVVDAAIARMTEPQKEGWRKLVKAPESPPLVSELPDGPAGPV